MELEEGLVIPGDTISCPVGSMPGFGTFEDNGQIVANTMGYPAMYNKLVCVNALKGRYQGETGNVVIGRISQVANNRWKVNVGSQQEAVLFLSSIDLPTGEHRIRSEADQLKMREYFNHNDLMSAEVQSSKKEGKPINLQTRSAKFGKLSNGMLVRTSPMLVERLKQHFLTLEIGVDLVFGRNGLIWVYYNTSEETEVPFHVRVKIIRVANIIKLLDKAQVMVSPESIMQAYENTLHVDLEDLLTSATLALIKESFSFCQAT